ncbi:hypothetical protein P3T76_007298 [Phytophthora citrophthora]|uniref:Uncharacterized protein n=1 Tax=Phytophthora citrophthora TaxID=4793 RepID=A0AAD9GMR4_9STRA|nr:hypothetical protein P3T76_007298 [Phytophthora citrophthora]
MVYETLADLLDGLQYCNAKDSIVVKARNLIEDLEFETMRIAFLLDPTKKLDEFVGDAYKKAMDDIPVVVGERLGYSGDMVKAIAREKHYGAR